MRLHSWGLILMAKLKKLVPGETLLGPIEDAIKREKGKNVTGPQTALLFYGNLIVDSEDPNKRYHIKPVESYYAFLENFLNSPEGQKYERPTKEEIDAAIAACVSSKRTDENSASVEPAGEENVPDPENEPTLKNDGSNQEPPDPEESDAEKEKPGKPKKRQFGRKSKKKELVPDPEPTDAENEELPTVIPVCDTLTNKALEARVMKLSRQIKRLKTLAIIFLLIAVAPVFLYQAGFIQFGLQAKTPADEIKIISLANNVKAGNVIKDSDLKEATITRDQFNDLSLGTAVDSNGNVSKDYVQRWSNRNYIVGKYAADNLSAGDYLLASDYMTLKSGVNMIEIDVDGTKVKVPVKSTQAASSDMRFYAIITSKDSEGKVSNYAINLGTLEFSGKSLKRILNEEGKSILEDYIQAEK